VELQFTLAEASSILDPPLSEAQLRDIIRALRWPAAGVRRSGRAGHPVNCYQARDLLDLHRALTPFIRPLGSST